MHRALMFFVAAMAITACGGRRRTVTAGTAVAAAPTQPGTTLTPNSPPLCGDFGRPYIAPGALGLTDPTPPPPGLGTVDERRSRILLEGEAYKSDYSHDDQMLIESGRARVGLDERALYLANGVPAFYWNTNIDGDQCRILLYGMLGEPMIDTAIYTCESEIVHIGAVQPRLPCWRVEEVVPRAIESAAHFDGAGVERQWEILYGLLRRGQSVQDIGISFGAPYRTGLEAREDGTNASQHVYLDNTGDAYGSYLTFVDGTLRGWRFPPDRQLTAEAEQRRLDAMERRMVDQLREMEQASIERHEAELAHLNSIQTNQEQIRSDIENARVAIQEHTSDESARTRGAVRRQGAGTRANTNAQHTQNGQPGQRTQGGQRTNTRTQNGPAPAGCQRFTYNGTTWSDRNGTAFGQRCGDQNGGCPDTYSCVIMGSTSGVCMPENPRLRCR